MSQAREAAVNEVLEDLHGALKGASCALVSRSGSVFAGKVPAAVNRESFAAMVAVMHGAAETGTADLGDEMLEVEARLRSGALVSLAAGRKMLLVVHLPEAAAADGARPKLQDAANRLAALF